MEADIIQFAEFRWDEGFISVAVRFELGKENSVRFLRVFHDLSRQCLMGLYLRKELMVNAGGHARSLEFFPTIGFRGGNGPNPASYFRVKIRLGLAVIPIKLG